MATIALSSCTQESSESAAVAAAGSSLGSAPISLGAALSARSGAPAVAADSCPFLSDQTAISTVRHADDFLLRRASNSECVWNRNIGFEIKVSVDAEASAKPIAQRLYNLENPPLIEPQSGPGSNAAIALDPTWKERAPRPYAFGFSLGDRYVFIRTTGVYTSVEQLRRAADEIATMLPNAAEVGAATVTIPAAAFDVCGIWNEDALSDLFGVGEGGSISSYASNSKTCIASIYPGRDGSHKISLDFIFSAGTPNEYEFRASKGWSTVEVAGRPALFKQNEDQFGQANQYMVMTEKGNFALTIISKRDSMNGKAEQLFENALSRFED